MGLSSPLPGKCRPSPSWARGHSAAHTALCICGGLVSVSRGLCGHLGGDLVGGDCSRKGICMSAWTQRGVCCSCGYLRCVWLHM